MSSCDKYYIKFYNFIIPSITEFKTICDSYDKTRMFITVFIRTITYYLIMIYLFEMNIIDYRRENRIKLYGLIILIFVIFLNILSLIYIIIKKQRNPKKISVPEEKEDEYANFKPIAYYESDIKKEIVCPVGFEKIR